MAIDTYENQLAALIEQTHYDDITTVLPDLYRQGEVRIYRNLRVRAMEIEMSIAISTLGAPLPADFVELKYAFTFRNNEAMDLEVRPAEAIVRTYKHRGAEARPRFIGIQASSFIFGPAPDSDYVLNGVYYRRLTALSTAGPTNWFTDNAPDLLMAAAKIEIYSFKEDFEKAAMWASKFSLHSSEVEVEQKRRDRTSTPIATKPDMRYR